MNTTHKTSTDILTIADMIMDKLEQAASAITPEFKGAAQDIRDAAEALKILSNIYREYGGGQFFD